MITKKLKTLLILKIPAEFGSDFSFCLGAGIISSEMELLATVPYPSPRP